MVDRPDKEKTITIKINGEHRSYLESKTEPLDKKMDIDYYSELEAAATKEAEEDDSFDWILPDDHEDENIVTEYKIVKKPTKKKTGVSLISSKFTRNKSGLFLSPVFIVIFFAIIVGTTFGVIMLKIVTTEKIVENAEPVNALPQPSKEKSSAIERLELQPLSAYVIQGGVFSNIASAKQMQAENSQKGIPTQIFERDGQAFLYLSVADSIDHAKAIGGQLSSKGVEVFAKSIIFDEKSLEGLQPAEKNLLGSIHSLYEVLATAATEAAVGKVIPDTLIRSAEQQAAAMKNIEVGQLKNERVLNIYEDLDKALEQLNVYKQSADEKELDKLQHYLLDFLVHYQTLQ